MQLDLGPMCISCAELGWYKAVLDAFKVWNIKLDYMEPLLSPQILV